MIKLTYHGIIYSKKNSKRILTNPRTGKSFIASNEKAKAMERVMANDFAIQGLRHQDALEELQGKLVEVEIKIWEKDRTRRDLDNQVTSLLDGLVKGGILEDDSIKTVSRISAEVAGFDKTRPRAEIIIKRKEGDG